jgi:hypothetical protein
MNLPLISAQLIVGASSGSVMDCSPLPRLARRLLALHGLCGRFIHTESA